MRSGISARHGPHQVAQKFSSITLPCHSESESGLPSSVSSLKSGAVSGLRTKWITLPSPCACSGKAAKSTRAISENIASNFEINRADAGFMAFSRKTYPGSERNRTSRICDGYASDLCDQHALQKCRSNAAPVTQTQGSPLQFGATQLKLLASFVSPLPLYFATCGYG